MTAGTGVSHSEFNASPDKKVHFSRSGSPPRPRAVAELRAKGVRRRGKAWEIASHRLARRTLGSVTVHQNVSLYAGFLGEGERATVEISKGRTAWVQVASGGITINGIALGEGDGAAVKEETALEIAGTQASEVLVFDLPS